MKDRTGTAASSGAPRGTQCIERSIALLREIAARGNFGLGVSELALRCRLDRGTTHRIMTCLMRERLVQRRQQDGHYLPGPLLYELGMSVPILPHAVEAFRLPLGRLAGHFGGVVTLTLRSGSEGVHVARHGHASMKILSRIGERKPLPLLTAGVAIMICLPHEEAQAILTQTLRQLAAAADPRASTIERVFRRSCERGFASDFNEKFSGVSSCAVAVRNAKEEPFAAISIFGQDQQFPPACFPQMAAAIREEIYKIETALAE